MAFPVYYSTPQRLTWPVVAVCDGGMRGQSLPPHSEGSHAGTDPWYSAVSMKWTDQVSQKWIEEDRG